MDFSLEMMVQVTPAQQLSLLLKLMSALAPAPTLLMEGTLTPALEEEVSTELEPALPPPLPTALLLPLAGALQLALQWDKEKDSPT